MFTHSPDASHLCPQGGGGLLGRLLGAVGAALGASPAEVQVVSVYEEDVPLMPPDTPQHSNVPLMPQDGPRPATAYVMPPAHPVMPQDPQRSRAPKRPDKHHAISGQDANKEILPQLASAGGSPAPPAGESTRPPVSPPATVVWVSVGEPGGGYMDPVKVLGLLALHATQVRV